MNAKLTPRLYCDLQQQHYRYIKGVQDKICALKDHVDTTAIVIGLSEKGSERTYHYSNKTEAEAAFNQYDNVDLHPTGPWFRAEGFMSDALANSLIPTLKENNPTTDYDPKS